MKKVFLSIATTFAISANASWIYALNGTVFVNGVIETGDAQKLDSQISNDTRKIVITSQGGSVEEAILMARSIRKSEKLLVAKRICASSCAIIFSLAYRTEIDDQTIIAFHAGDFEWRLSMLKRMESYVPQTEGFRPHFEEKRAEIQAASDRLADVRQAVFRDFALPYFWHQAVIDLTSLQVIDIEVEESKKVIKTIVKHGVCDWWVPDIEGLKEAGINVPTYKQLDRREIAGRLKSTIDRIYWGRLHDLQGARDRPCPAVLKNE